MVLLSLLFLEETNVTPLQSTRTLQYFVNRPSGRGIGSLPLLFFDGLASCPLNMMQCPGI